MEDKTYTIRPLTADDIFPMCKIISTLGADAVQTCMESPTVKKAIERDEVGAESVGVAVVAQAAVVILGRLNDCRDDLYNFLSGLTGLANAEIGAMAPARLMRMVASIIHREDFRDFFAEACALFKLVS